MRLEGKVALVTGAAQGIGQAVALVFAREGADVIPVDINLELAQKVADEIRSLGRKAEAIKADVSKSRDVDRMTAYALDKFKRIDILVNNAAPSNRDRLPIEDTTEAMWDRMLDVNLKGAFLCSKAVGKGMIEQKSGKIINIASTAGTFAAPGHLPYCVSKGGLLQLTRVFAAEWGRHNINVNAVSPAGTLTAQSEYSAKERPGRAKASLRRYPLRRYNRPEDVANAVVFLASSDADNITGADVMVDGGVHAVQPHYVWPEEYGSDKAV